MKKVAVLLLVLTLILNGTACSVIDTEPTNTGTVSVIYDSSDMDANWSGTDMSYITLAGEAINFDGGGAIVADNIITITSGGTYSINGTLNDGQIRINTNDNEIVRLVLNGVDITFSTSAPIYVINSGKTVITLADNTENYVTDRDSYIYEESETDEPNAAIFSKDDLTINGNGTLTVDANYNNGIQSKDGLKIVSGTITINAVNDGVKGRDYIAIKGGAITIESGGDGMQSNNDEDSAKGFIIIEGGTINASVGEDGIQVETSLIIKDGDITIASGGGSSNSNKTDIIEDPWGGDWGDRVIRDNPDDMAIPDGSVWDMPEIEDNPDKESSASSAKGIKAGVDITIDGGTINIDSADDSIHSNEDLTINGGNITLASGDDGMHADSTLEINGGNINITESYEGIESSTITINGGNIHLIASDDGINATDGNDGFMVNGQLGQADFNFSQDNHLYINGGYIVIDAAGDGIDINGSIDITGGTVIVNGPTSNNNGPLDYLSSFKISGGLLIAVGSSGMAQAPDTSSTQYSVMVNLTSIQPADTIIHIETEGGEETLTFLPNKAYQSIVLSSPELENGLTYTVYAGGNATGTAADGLYSGGTYTAGTQVATFTISSIVTSAGISESGFPGGAGNMRPGGIVR